MSEPGASPVAPPASIRVFVNGTGVDVPRTARVLDAVRAWRADEADATARDERVVTDSRGLPVNASTATYAGAIYRVVAARRRDGEATPRAAEDADAPTDDYGNSGDGDEDHG